MANYYVAKNGNNGWDGSEGTPWLTINYAETQVGANDTVYVKAGTYADGLIDLSGSYSSGNECTFRVYSNDTVIIANRLEVSGDWYIVRDFEFVTADSQGDYAEVNTSGTNNKFYDMYCYDYSGMQFRGGAWIEDGASNNIFYNFRSVESGGLYINDGAGSGNQFIGGELWRTESIGIRMGGSYTLIEDMDIHEMGSWWGHTGSDDCDGIVIHGQNHTIRDCKIYQSFRIAGGQHTDAIQWWTTVHGLTIEGCIIGSTETGPWNNEIDWGSIQFNGYCDNVTIRNNVFVDTENSYVFNCDSAGTETADNWEVCNNIFRGPQRIRYDNDSCFFWKIKNNVFYWDGPDYYNGSGYDVDYNVYVNSNDSPWEGTHSHEQESSAGFIDDDIGPPDNDYGVSCDWHLTAGSICIDAADSTYMTTLDPDGNSRYDDPLVTNIGMGPGGAYWDIAKYEYQGVGGGQIETLQGSSAGGSTAGIPAMVSIRDLTGSSNGGSTASAHVFSPGIVELAGQANGASTASATVVLRGGEVTIGGQSNGGSTASASVVIADGGELSATLLADTQIRADSQATNYGSYVDLEVYRDVTNEWSRVTILRFDFTDIPGGQRIDTAVLGLWCFSDPGASQVLYARHLESVGNAFTEGGSTWDTYDGTNVWDSGDFSDSDMTTANQGSDTSTGVNDHWFYFSIKDMVQHAYDNHAKILEVAITTDDDSEERFLFDSKEEPGGNAPELELTYSSAFENLAGQSNGDSTVGCNLTKVSVAYRYPESDDAETDGTFTYVPSSPETVWDKVDDPYDNPDEDSTYVIHQSNETNYTADSTAFAIPAGSTIDLLEIVLRHKKIGSGAASIETSIKVGDTWYDADITDPTQDVWSDTRTEYPNNPNTSQPWTVDQINGIGGNALDTFGWYVTDADPDVYVTNVLLRVLYFGEIKTLAGSSNGVATVNGAVSPQRGLPGTSDGSSTATASLSIEVDLAGVSNGVSTVTAKVELTGVLKGASDGLSTAGAVIKRTSRMIVASDGVATVTIVLKRIREMAGASDSSTSTTGAVTNILKEIAGVSSGTSTAGALLGAIEKLAGATNGVATVGASLDVSKYIEGATDGLSTTTATIEVTKNLVGIANGTGVVSDIPLEILSKLAGDSAGTSIVTTLVKITKELIGQSVGSSTAAIVEIKCALDIGGASDGTATVGASLTTGQEETLAGQSDGLSTVVGSLAITTPFIGSSDGIATVSVTLDVTSKFDGQANGVATVSSVLNILKPFAGSSNGTATVSALVRELQDLAGTTDGLSTAGSIINITKKLIGITVGTSTSTGSFLITRSIDGSSTGNSSVSSLIKVSKKLVGASNGSSTSGADIEEATLVAGIATGTSTVTATIGVERELAGTTNGTSTASATVEESSWLVGSSDGTSTVTVSIKVLKELGGVANGVALPTAFLGVLKEVVGITNGTSTVTGNVMITRGVIGAADGSSISIALVNILKTLSSLSTGTSTVSATIEERTNLSGTSSGTSLVSGILNVSKLIAGGSDGSSTTTAILLETTDLGGTTEGISTVGAGLKVEKKFVGATAGGSTATASWIEETLLACVAIGSSTASANMLRTRGLIGQANGLSTVQAAWEERTHLQGSTAGSSTVVATADITKELALDVIVCNSTVGALVKVLKEFVGQANGLAQVDNVLLKVDKELVSTSTGISTAGASVKVLSKLIGSSTGTCVVTAIPRLKIVRTVDGLAAGQSTADVTVYVLFVLSGVTNGTCTITIYNLAIGKVFDTAIAGTSTATLDLGKRRYHQLGYCRILRLIKGRMVVIRPK